jgi:hypothetical protein
MKRKEDIIWILTYVTIFIGFILMIKSIYDVVNFYFIGGLLLYTLGCYWFAYGRGYNMGRIAQRDEQRKKSD